MFILCMDNIHKTYHVCIHVCMHLSVLNHVGSIDSTTSMVKYSFGTYRKQLEFQKAPLHATS